MAGTLGVLLTLALIAPSGAASATTPPPTAPIVTPLGVTAGFAQSQVPAPQEKEESQRDEQAPQERRPRQPASGHVKQRNGNAADGARIVASHAELGKLEPVFADSNGKFELRAPAGKTLPEGDYSLEILFQKKTAKFASKLEDGQLTPDEFELP